MLDYGKWNNFNKKKFFLHIVRTLRAYNKLHNCKISFELKLKLN